MSPYEMQRVIEIFAASPAESDDLPMVSVIALLLLFALVLVLAVAA